MSHTLQIAELSSIWLMPRNHPATQLPQGHLDEMFTRSLPAALSSLLESQCAVEDESVWLIKSLEVSFDADVAWESSRVTDGLAASLAQSLVKKMQSDGDGDSVIHYRTRAEYLAAFLADLAHGTAWNKWQYESFGGLRSLPTSSALRTLMITETGVALSALAMMTSSTLRRVMATLLSQDAELAWSRMTRDSLQPDAAVLGRAIDVWQMGKNRLPSCSSAQGALELLIHILNGEGALTDDSWQQAASAAAAISALDRMRKGAAAEQWAEVRAALLSGNLGNLPRTVWATAGTGLQFWSDHPSLLQRAAVVLVEEEAASSTQAESIATAFGGVFLLLPLIETLPTDSWSTQPALLKFAICVRCCAPEVRSSARWDSFLRDLFSVAPDCVLEGLALKATGDDIREWMRSTEHVATQARLDASYLGAGEKFALKRDVTSDAIAIAAHAVLRGFAWKLPGFGNSSLRHLWSNFLDFPARVDLMKEKIVVRMSPAPLHTILRIAGLNNGSYTLPGVDPRPFHLFQET
jgi:hypothetical protein